MEYISGERVWSELKRILTGNHAVAITRTMQEVGLNRHMGLPDNETGLNLLEMDSVLARAKSNGFQLSPATILASMLHSQGIFHEMSNWLIFPSHVIASSYNVLDRARKTLFYLGLFWPAFLSLTASSL